MKDMGKKKKEEENKTEDIKEQETAAEEISEETDDTEKETGNDENADVTDKEKEPEEEKKDPKDAKIEELNDKVMRQMAEFDNFRKRTEKEKDQMFEVGAKSIIEKILPIIDNFERAEQNKDISPEDYRKGIEMIFKQLNDAIAKLGAEPFGEVGDKFDPLLYAAVMHIDDDSLGEDVVSAVFQKGYKLGDRVIRCATVQVAN